MKQQINSSEDKKVINIIGEKILSELEHKNLSVIEFSKKIGINANTIYRITWGTCNPTILTLAKICKGLNISLESLFEE